MLRVLLIGMIAGMRSMTPLAAVCIARRCGLLPRNNGFPAFTATRSFTTAASALALGEMVGDKLRWAPDRTIAPGIAARVVTGAMTAVALAPRESRINAAILGASSAVFGAYVSFAIRARTIRRFGQRRSGLIEDLLVVGASAWLLASAPREKRL